MPTSKQFEIAGYLAALDESDQLVALSMLVFLLPTERVRDFVEDSIYVKEHYSDEERIKMFTEG